MTYYPTEYGDSAMKKTVKRVMYSFEPGKNKIVVDYKENTVDSDESFVPIFADSVRHTWYILDTENFIEVKIGGLLF